MNVGERIKLRCGDIIRPNNTIICDKSLVPEGHQLGEKAKFQLLGRSGHTEVKASFNFENL